MAGDRERQLEDALLQFLQPIRGIPFDLIIKALCNVSVLPFDRGDQAHAALLDRIASAMEDAGRAVKANPIVRARPNEVGNDMEPFVIEALKRRGLSAAAPTTRDGSGKATGYPDVRISGDPPLFIEVKTYAVGKPSTTMRSFYLSPSETPKVWEDGIHLLVGFAMRREGDRYWPVAFSIVDLFGLPCDMKAEFNSDNRRLYDPARSLIQIDLA
jgi:hypothetical protein